MLPRLRLCARDMNRLSAAALAKRDSDERRGTGGFGYDPLFLCETGETFAQITPETKNAISHRKRGIEAVLRALEEEE